MLSKIRYRLGLTKPSPPKEIVPTDSDVTAEERALIELVTPFTLTGPEAIVSLTRAIEYITTNQIPGAFVECGVWRGGSMLATAITLKQLKDESRELWLYDTFEGMSAPTDEDANYAGVAAAPQFEETTDGEYADWCRASLEDVQANVAKASYPTEKIRYIRGKVEDTLLESVPEKIALLRLDTDFYASTKAEMEILFPRLVSGGILIVDDYGYWQGARQAVDEYVQLNNIRLFLSRVDHTVRIAVKS